MKVGDLVRHKICGLGVIVEANFTEKNYLVFYPAKREGKRKMITRRSYLEIISESW